VLDFLKGKGLEFSVSPITGSLYFIYFAKIFSRYNYSNLQKVGWKMTNCCCSHACVILPSCVLVFFKRLKRGLLLERTNAEALFAQAESCKGQAYLFKCL